MEQHHNNVPSHPSLFQQPQQTQMALLNIRPHTQLPCQQQVYDSPFASSNPMWIPSVTASYLQSTSAVRMTPSVIAPSLHTTQPRAVGTPVATLHDQYGSSSQQRPLYGMCDHPTGGAPLLPPAPPLQVSCDQSLLIMQARLPSMHN